MNTETRRVVVGIEDSPDPTAIRWAGNFARVTDRPLHLLHAFDPPVPYADNTWPETEPFTETPDHVSLANGVVAEAMKLVPEDVRVTGEALMGYPADLLVEASEHADLVVVGSRKRHAAASLFLGSVGNAVAARSVGPAVVVRGGADCADSMGPIVVGVDGSQLSESALGFGFDYASRKRVPLVAVMCWWPSGYGSYGLSDPWQQNYRSDTERLLAECVAGWQEKYPDVSVARRAIVEPPARGLSDAAKGAGLLVLGAHSRHHGPRTASFLGSVTQAVLHQVDLPIAILHN